uniref:Putative secreted protein n=1 Tax=Ixodes ricinus TaxID=34613 RepID=A0A6B0UGX5_IXORI
MSSGQVSMVLVVLRAYESSPALALLPTQVRWNSSTLMGAPRQRSCPNSSTTRRRKPRMQRCRQRSGSPGATGSTCSATLSSASRPGVRRRAQALPRGPRLQSHNRSR